VYKNATAPIIVMLGHTGLDMEILDADMETTESNDCKGVSRKDGDTNGMLAMTQEEVRVSYKDR